MTIKKAIAIGLLTSTVVGLLALGIKFKWIKKENTHTQIKADDIDHQKELDEHINIPINKVFNNRNKSTKTLYRNELNPTNLTRYTWIANNSLTFPYTNFEYTITFTSNEQEYNSMSLIVYQNTDTDDQEYYEYYLNYNNNNVYYYMESTPIVVGYEIWANDAYKTIQITGGSDANNTNLITWLQANGTLTPPPPTTIEVIPIHNLMLQILTMPFTFITQAFDVTLWPGTEYAFNIKSFIMGLIAIASILFIIKLFTSGFAIIGNYTHSSTDTKLKKSQIEYNKAKTNLANRTDPNTKTTKIKKEK